MNPYFEERVSSLIDALSWEDIFDISTERGSISCPFCHKKNKAYLYPNFFKCFSSRCNVKGSKIKMYQEIHSLTFWEAVKHLESQKGLNPHTQLKDLEERNKFLHTVIDVYHNELFTNPNNSGVLDYLISRGFTSEFLELWKIGYASHDNILATYGINYRDLTIQGLAKNRREFFDKRIIFPIFNSVGSLVHLTGREFPRTNRDRDFKYLDSPSRPSMPAIGSSKDYFLFENELANYRNYPNTNKTLYLVEGVPDSFILKQLGYPVVGLMGLNKLLAQGLKKFDGFEKIIAIFDNDRYESTHLYFANQKKSWRVVTNQLLDLQLYLGQDSVVSCCTIPEGIRIKNSGSCIKDVNDLYLYLDRDTNLLKKYLAENTKDIIKYMLDEYGGDLAKHQTILKLVSATNRGKELIEPYIPQELSSLDYALKVFNS